MEEKDYCGKTWKNSRGVFCQKIYVTEYTRFDHALSYSLQLNYYSAPFLTWFSPPYTIDSILLSYLYYYYNYFVGFHLVLLNTLALYRITSYEGEYSLTKIK